MEEIIENKQPATLDEEDRKHYKEIARGFWEYMIKTGKLKKAMEKPKEALSQL